METDCLQERISPREANLETPLHPANNIEYTLWSSKIKKKMIKISFVKSQTISNTKK